jgi:hypothetical protein
MKYTTKEQVVDELVNKWNCKKDSFYDTNKNHSAEKLWTFKYTLQYLEKLEKEYFLTINGSRAHNSLKGILT